MAKVEAEKMKLSLSSLPIKSLLNEIPMLAAAITINSKSDSIVKRRQRI
jgi:hypothetical protein